MRCLYIKFSCDICRGRILTDILFTTLYFISQERTWVNIFQKAAKIQSLVKSGRIKMF